MQPTVQHHVTIFKIRAHPSDFHSWSRSLFRFNQSLWIALNSALYRSWQSNTRRLCVAQDRRRGGQAPSHRAVHHYPLMKTLDQFNCHMIETSRNISLHEGCHGSRRAADWLFLIFNSAMAICQDRSCHHERISLSYWLTWVNCSENSRKLVKTRENIWKK